jgi:hypothetical protein
MKMFLFLAFIIIFFKSLAWEGIIIHEVISTTNEFTIIVSDDQIDVAFKVIKDLKNVFD